MGPIRPKLILTLGAPGATDQNQFQFDATERRPRKVSSDEPVMALSRVGRRASSASRSEERASEQILRSRYRAPAMGAQIVKGNVESLVGAYAA
jgi:hypothetical protein